MKATVFRTPMLGFQTPHCTYDVWVAADELGAEHQTLASHLIVCGTPHRQYVTLGFATASRDHLHTPAGTERLQHHCARIGAVEQLARRLCARAFPEADAMRDDRIEMWWPVTAEHAVSARREVEIEADDLAWLG